MITEQELNAVGKEQYLAFVDLIRELLDTHGTRRPLVKVGDTTPLANRPLIESEELFIPDNEINKIKGLSVATAIDFLIKDHILRKFRGGPDEQWSSFSEVPAGYPEYVTPDMQMSLIVYRRMNVGVRELDQYITDLHALGKNKNNFAGGDVKLIQRDAQGNYSYAHKKIEIPKETISYKVFDAIFVHSNQDGFLSYENIDKQLVRAGEPKCVNFAAAKKRISNATSEHAGFFRSAKVGSESLKNKTPSGDGLIKVIRGKGLQLNNPDV